MPENIDRIIRYLKAYNASNPISEQELRNTFAVYFQVNIHSFWIESEHYLKGNTRVDCFLEQRSTEHLAKHKEEFLDKVVRGVYGA